MSDSMSHVAHYIVDAKWTHGGIVGKVLGPALEIIPICGPMSLVCEELFRLSVDYINVCTTCIDLGSLYTSHDPWNSNRPQYAEDQNDDHQLNQRKCSVSQHDWHMLHCLNKYYLDSDSHSMQSQT